MRLVHMLIALALLLTACTTSAPKPAPVDPNANPVPVTPVPANPAPAVPAAPVTTAPKPVPASANISYRYGDAWQQVTPLASHVPSGPAEIRVSFSKPVRAEEVERILQEAQAAPIRGAMQWLDGRTLLWRVAQLPPRVDFLLGEAHDEDGLPLPGGLPSLRVGGAPSLVEVDVAQAKETQVTTLPPDILYAALSHDRKALNLKVWTPGATRWDWRTADMHLVLDGLTFGPDTVERFQPRLPANLESWSLSPAGNLVAGLKVGAGQGQRDLVLADVLGTRQQVTEAFVRRSGNTGNAGVAWAPDGERIAALTDVAGGADLVLMRISDRSVTTTARNLPISAGVARLAWSSDGRFLLAGTVLVDLQTGAQTRLPGDVRTARGAWEPESSRLLYGAKDWEDCLLIDALTGETQPLGTGLVVDWAASGRAYVIRWPAAATRYVPPGQ